mgnify:CR=1 FL=1
MLYFMTLLRYILTVKKLKRQKAYSKDGKAHKTQVVL